MKTLRALNILPRAILASRYYNQRYKQILKWAFTSRENTNFTFKLKESNLKTLAQTVSVVTNCSYEEAYNYIEEINNDEDLKKHVIEKTISSDHKAVADARCDLHKRIGWYAFVRVTKPKVVVETGIDKGLGAVTLCAGLLRNQEEGFPGRYYGTDINKAAGYLLDGKYKAVGTILYGDSIGSLQKLDETIDIFINDSDHSAEYEYNEYKTIKNKLSAKAIILGDNSHVTDRLLQFSIEHGRQYLFFKEEPLNHWYPGLALASPF